MGPKKDALNTKERKQYMRGFKRYLSKEIIEGTWTAGDQAYLDFWTAEKISHISKLEELLENKMRENDDLKGKLKQTEDRYGQQIADLREKVNEKCEEIAQMTEANHALIEGKAVNMKDFDALLNAEDQKFINTKERLTAEIKQLNSKLRSLEEFRFQRDGLIDKYSAQLKYLQSLEKSATTIVTDYKKLDLVNKDRMGQELKERLLKLSIEFQEASQTETTRSLIRENIAINNELGGHIGSWQALHDQNQELKKQRYLMRNDLRTEESLREKCLALNVLQSQVLDRLAFEHQKLDGYYEEIKSLEQLKSRQEKKLEKLSKKARETEHETKLLAQGRHDLETQVSELDREFRGMFKVIQEEEITLKKALLHVADGQELRQRRARNRLSPEELRLKLSKILREMKTLLKEALKNKTPSIASIGGSMTTLFDPDYAVKYWKARGVSVGHLQEQKKEEITHSESRQSSDDSSDSS